MNSQKPNQLEQRQERQRWNELIETILGDCLPDNSLADVLANSMIATIGAQARRRPWNRGVQREMQFAYCEWMFQRHQENWNTFLSTVFAARFSVEDLAELRNEIARIAFKAHSKGDKFSSPRARQRAFERWLPRELRDEIVPAARVAAAA